MRTTGAILAVLLAASVARGDQTEWDGVWRLADTDEQRVVTCTSSGATSISLPVAGTTVTCSGVDGASLQLAGDITRTIGLTGALAGREGESGPVRVRVDVRRLEPDATTGTERAQARISVRGRRSHDETWTRAARAALKIVRTECPSGGTFDPLRGPLKVHVRVLGRPQHVDLEVSLPPRAEAQRTSFYVTAAGLADRVIRRRPSTSVLPVGDHALEWDGRDGTSDRRIALAGEYVLRVDSPEARESPQPIESRDAARAQVTVGRPRGFVHVPRLKDLPTDPAGSQGIAGSLDGYDLELRTYLMDGRAFMRDLATSAVVVANTHGAVGAFLTGDAKGIGASSVEGFQRLTVAESNDAKPLKDVHALFVIACEAGAVATPIDPETGRPTPVTSLTEAMKHAGVDVVVAFKGKIVEGETASFQDHLGLKLLEYGMPIKRATEDAAAESFERWWEGKDLSVVDRAVRKAVNAWLSFQGSSALRDVLDVDVAPGIDEGTETLFPPRHGCSTN